MDQILSEAQLPIRMAAFGHCFRTEAGAAGGHRGRCVCVRGSWWVRYGHKAAQRRARQVAAGRCARVVCLRTVLASWQVAGGHAASWKRLLKMLQPSAVLGPALGPNPPTHPPNSHQNTPTAGSASRGLYRVHQFSKVEMFVVCTPEQVGAALLLRSRQCVGCTRYAGCIWWPLCVDHWLGRGGHAAWACCAQPVVPSQNTCARHTSTRTSPNTTPRLPALPSSHTERRAAPGAD